MSERRDFLIQAIADRERRKSEGVGLQAQETIDSEIQAFKAELEQLDAEETLAQKMEEKVEEEISFNIPGVDFTDLPAEFIKLANIIVKADRRRILSEHMNELTQVHNDYRVKLQTADNRIDECEKIIENGKAENASLIHDNGNLRDHIAKVNDEIEEWNQKCRQIETNYYDALSKRDAAVRELDDAKAEIERLNSQVAEYQRAKVFGERASQQVIDITPEDSGTETVQELVNSLKQKYVKSEDWGSVIKVVKEDGTFDLMKRSEFEKQVKIDLPSIGEPQGNTFQEDHPIDNGTTNGVLPPEESVTFQDNAGVQEVQHGNEQENSGTNEPAVGTLAEAFERIARLEQEVFSKVESAA